MASTGNPSVQGGLQWPEWNIDTSMGVHIVNTTTVGTVDYSPCAFWDMINAQYLNFTSSGSANETSDNNNNNTGSGPEKNGAERRVEKGVWGLILGVGIAASVLMG
jgi:hypothetical protein